jgi:hypothetical protein
MYPVSSFKADEAFLGLSKPMWAWCFCLFMAVFFVGPGLFEHSKAVVLEHGEHGLQGDWDSRSEAGSSHLGILSANAVVDECGPHRGLRVRAAVTSDPFRGEEEIDRIHTTAHPP